MAGSLLQYWHLICFTLLNSMIDASMSLLKPVARDHRGLREKSFYEYVWTSSDPDIIRLQQFVPRYYGTVQVSTPEGNVWLSTAVDARIC